MIKRVRGANTASNISQKERDIEVGVSVRVSSNVSCAYTVSGMKKVVIDSNRYFIVVLMIYIF